MHKRMNSVIASCFGLCLLLADDRGLAQIANYNLSLSQTATTLSYNEVAYSYQVTRSGSPTQLSPGAAVRNVTLTVLLPTSVRFLSSTPAGTPCTADSSSAYGATVTCNLGSVEAITTSSVTIRGRIASGPNPQLNSAAGVISVQNETTKNDNFVTDTGPSTTVTGVGPWPGTWSPCAGTAIYPNNPPGPGRKIRICGNGLGGATSVTLDGTPAVINSNTASEILVTAGTRAGAPASSPGPIVIGFPGARFVTVENAFHYAFRGDANNNGTVTGADAFYLQMYVFLGGPPPASICAGDTNTNNQITGADVFFLNNFIFLGGPAPSEIGDPTVGDPPPCVIPLARPAEGLAEGPKDALSLGQASVGPGETAIIPVSITDQPGTRMDASKNDPIGAFSVFFRFPEGLVTGGRVALSGACTGMPILKDFVASGADFFLYTIHFDPRQRALPFSEKSSGPGDECLRLELDVSRTAPRGSYELVLDDERTVLASKSGRIGASKREEPLKLNNGRITVR